MKKLIFSLSCVCFVMLCGCQKNDCQTFLQGSWHVVYPADSSTVIMDSVYFYQADSIHELYKLRASSDTLRSLYSSYFITDQCDEIDFNGTNTWDRHTVLQYHILQVTNSIFQIRSKADSSSCNSCIVSFQR